MAGRGTARIDRRGPGGGTAAGGTAPLSRRIIRLGPPANDNPPAFRSVLRVAALAAAVGAMAIFCALLVG